MNAIIAIAVLVILGVILGWHWLFAGVIAVTATVWAIVIASIAMFCVGILLLFILTGLGVFMIGLIGFIWTILAIILFPIVFPILVPLFIILLFISFIRDRQKN